MVPVVPTSGNIILGDWRRSQCQCVEPQRVRSAVSAASCDATHLGVPGYRARSAAFTGTPPTSTRPLLRHWHSNTDGTAECTTYYLYDANFNVTALVDTSGAVQVRYVYDPYGAVTWLKGNRFRHSVA